MTYENNKLSNGGIAPYGYRWHGGILVIDHKEAPIRKLIYELFLKHKRKKTVAKLLNNLGYRTRSGSLFSDTTIARLLRDTTATGKRILKGSEIRVDPIIEIELWERVNNILEGKKKIKQSVHLFSGILYCGCGGRMIVPSGSSKYVCKKCRHRIPADDLKEIFETQISNIEIDSIGTEVCKQTYLSDYWNILSDKDKILIIETLCEKIIVNRNAIDIELAFSPHSSKTDTFEQQKDGGNETYERKSATDSNSVKITEPLLSEVEAAKFLGISKMTLFRKRTAGNIGFFRVGFRVLYSKEKHLIPFLQNCEK